MGDMNACRVLVGKQAKRDYYEDLDIGQRTILRQTLEKYTGIEGTGFTLLRILTSGGFL
jgi:hypothetical protein